MHMHASSTASFVKVDIHIRKKHSRKTTAIDKRYDIINFNFDFMFIAMDGIMD